MLSVVSEIYFTSLSVTHFSVGSIVPVLVALLNYLCNVLLSLHVAVVHCDTFPCTGVFFFRNSDMEHAGQV